MAPSRGGRPPKLSLHGRSRGGRERCQQQTQISSFSQGRYIRVQTPLPQGREKSSILEEITESPQELHTVIPALFSGIKGAIFFLIKLFSFYPNSPQLEFFFFQHLLDENPTTRRVDAAAPPAAAAAPGIGVILPVSVSLSDPQLASTAASFPNHLTFSVATPSRSLLSSTIHEQAGDLLFFFDNAQFVFLYNTHITYVHFLSFLLHFFVYSILFPELFSYLKILKKQRELLAHSKWFRYRYI